MLFNSKIPKSIRPTYLFDSKSYFYYGFFDAIIMSFAPYIMRKLGATDFAMWVISIAPIVGTLMVTVWLNLALKAKKLKFVALMKSTGIVILFIPFFIPNPYVFGTCFLIYNILEKGSMPSYVSIMRSIYPTKYRGMAMGMVRIESKIISLIIALIAGKLFDNYDFRLIFFFGISCGLLSQFYFYKIKKTTTIHTFKNAQKFKFKELYTILNKDKLLFKYFLIFFFTGFGNLISATLYLIYLVDVLKLSNTSTGILLAIKYTALIMGFYIWGRHMDKHDPMKTRVYLTFIFALIPLSYLLTGFLPELYFIFIITAFFSQGFALSGGELSRSNFIIQVVEHRQIEKYWAIDFILLGIRGLTAPALGLILKNLVGFRVVFIIGFISLFSSAFLMHRYYNKNHEELKRRGLQNL